MSSQVDLIEWFDTLVKKRVFASRFHGVELYIMGYQEKREKEGAIR